MEDERATEAEIVRTYEETIIGVAAKTGSLDVEIETGLNPTVGRESILAALREKKRSVLVTVTMKPEEAAARQLVYLM